MGVQRFEDLRVWQDARDLNARVGKLLKESALEDRAGLGAQLSNAALSVMSNIAEGFLRHRDREFLHFLRIAGGSNGEVRSILIAADVQRLIAGEDAADVIEHTNRIGRQIRRLQAVIEQRLERRPSRTRYR